MSNGFWDEEEWKVRREVLRNITQARSAPNTNETTRAAVVCVCATNPVDSLMPVYKQQQRHHYSPSLLLFFWLSSNMVTPRVTSTSPLTQVHPDTAFVSPSISPNKLKVLRSKPYCDTARVFRHKVVPTHQYSLRTRKHSTSTRKVTMEATAPKPRTLDILQTLQSTYARIIASFTPNEFKPLWFLSNHHVQTILGVFIPRLRIKVWYKSYQLQTQDKSTVTLDFLAPYNGHNKEYVPTLIEMPQSCGNQEQEVETDTQRNPKPVVILCHGLESSSRGLLSKRIAQAMSEQGFHVCAMNFRGCGASEKNTASLKDYHLGFTDDLDLVVKFIHKLSPKSEIYLAGFSLGGNIVLKYLGENAGKVHEWNVKGASAVCVPFDPYNGQAKVHRLFTQNVYMARFLRSLKLKALEKRNYFPDLLEYDKIMSVNTVAEFDHNFIAPIFGFKGKDDYYQQADSKKVLAHIEVPTLVINALDDPLVEEAGLPNATNVGKAPVLLKYTKHGGHCGYIDRLFGIPYLPREMARFIAHAHSAVVSEN